MVREVSAKGIAALTYLEGCPLKAYRDVVGVWTIGAGLTASSGVVRPRAGMVISRAQADRLLAEALERNYVPAVIKVMGTDQKQHVVDGAVSFHFNTGAIRRASWVKEFLRGNYAGARAGLTAWRKAGGRVLAGLVKRREIEADMIINGKYPAVVEKQVPPSFADMYARFAVPVGQEDIKRIGDDLECLGYMLRDGERLRKAGVEQFQKDHNLAIDGMIGRAMLSALSREIDARVKSKVTATTGIGGGVVGAGDEVTGVADGWALMAGLTVLAVKINPYLPCLAKFLWSF